MWLSSAPLKEEVPGTESLEEEKQRGSCEKQQSIARGFGGQVAECCAGVRGLERRRGHICPHNFPVALHSVTEVTKLPDGDDLPYDTNQLMHSTYVHFPAPPVSSWN